MPEPVDLRILQANERTLLAWIRTGLALLAFGFVVARVAMWLRFEGYPSDAGASLGLGIALIGVGIGCQVIGAVRFASARRALLAGHTPVPGMAGPVAIAVLVAAAGAALMLYVLVA